MFSALKSRVSEVFSSFSSTPAKALRTAMLAGDEAKAIEIYAGDGTTSSGGSGSKGGSGKRPLSEDLHPSMPFVSKKHADMTPLHLAAQLSLNRLCAMFLARGGNPNSPNARDETALHWYHTHAHTLNTHTIIHTHTHTLPPPFFLFPLSFVLDRIVCVK
jgi:hypothetical protein